MYSEVDNSRFGIFVLTPAGLCDPTLAIAASRAGATGVLNLETGAADEASARAAFARLSSHKRKPIGIKLSCHSQGHLGWVLESDPLPAVLIVDVGMLQECAQSLADCRRAGVHVMAEVTEWRADYAELQTTLDGWWLKGHEAGGLIGDATSFILLQQLSAGSRLPFHVRGGVNLHSVAACRAAGAHGVVLDDQLLLAKESPLADALGLSFQFFSGLETSLIAGALLGEQLRVWSKPGSLAARELARDFSANPKLRAGDMLARLDWQTFRDGGLVPLGQDGASAQELRQRFGSVGRIVRAFREAAERPIDRDAVGAILGPHSPLAKAHGTQFGVVQGPMTHVSDRPAFVRAVAEAGGLPMFAVSLMTGQAVKENLQATKKLLGELPWGVGLLGFVPTATFEAQREALLQTRPPFAIIAGGRPDQSRELDQAGIATYLHVPSPTLLRQYLEQGCRHFIFEGRECGGHIGPLSSFVLWAQMADCIAAFASNKLEPESLHVLLAGGIHDSRSAAIAAIAAGSLARLGVRVGILMGTGYVFTAEVVQSGAITPLFQETVRTATQTVGLTTGPGHTSRCARNPFVEQFWATRAELERQGKSANEIRDHLEALSLGRLRLASKGTVRRTPDNPEQKKTSRRTQQRDGMFMIGQAAMLRSEVQSIEQLHESVSTGALAWLSAQAGATAPKQSEAAAQRPLDVAIIGISCILPGAADKEAFWNNLLDCRDAITEIPADRWDWRPYFDPDRNAADKIYSKWGGFISDVVFDPTRFGMPPNSVASIDPLQLLSLVAVQQALDDAGYGDGQLSERERTSVVLGFSGGLGDLGTRYGARAELPRLALDVNPTAYGDLPRWTEDSFAGLLPNVAAGRIANRFDFGGVNLVVDAACASSLAALYHAVAELQSGRSDLVISGGIDTVEGPFAFLCFSKAQALSPSGRCRTFDADADGIAISEGFTILVLKRLADAERDGDRIYAVIKGLAGSSDGKAKGLMAPRPAGQRRALARAYDQAAIAPDTVDLVEAHGTGTVAGDRAELEALTEVLLGADARPQSVQVGSVKSLIGHTKATAGAVGLAKVALALHHRVLPPHAGVKTPNPALQTENSPLYLSQRPRPWLKPLERPRRAAVSSFGFGGTNFHVVLEQYDGEFQPRGGSASRSRWPAELFLWRERDADALAERIGAVAGALDLGARPPLAHLARALYAAAAPKGAAAAIVARSHEELRARLELLMRAPSRPTRPLPPGVAINPDAAPAVGKMAFLFSGQGAQYRHMLADTLICFAEARETAQAAANLLQDLPTFAERQTGRIADLIYPPDAFDAEEAARQSARLTRTDVAQPALGMVQAALLRVLQQLGLSADMAAGHSYGEYVALYYAGALSFEDLMRVSEARGRCIVDAVASGDLGTMAAVAADADTVGGVLGDATDIQIANYNGPQQTILSGGQAAVESAVQRLRAAGLTATPIPVAAAFHSKLLEPARAPFADFVGDLAIASPALPVYSNTTAEPHATAPTSIRRMLARHLTEPVRFQAMIERMYADGARKFVEIGPKSILTDLTRSILGDRPHVAVAMDGAGGSLQGMLAALATLFVHGVDMRGDYLFQDRVADGGLELEALLQPPGPEVLPAHKWLLNGTRVYRPEAASDGAVAAGDKPGRPLPQPSIRDMPPHQTDSAKNIGTPAALSAENNKRGPSSGRPVLPLQLAEAAKSHQENAMSKSRLGAGGDLPHRDSAMAEYYRTMRQFLQSQERLMLAYLSNGSGANIGQWYAGDATEEPRLSSAGAAQYAVVDSEPPPEGQWTEPQRPEDQAPIVARSESLQVPAVTAPPAHKGNGSALESHAAAARGSADFRSILLDVVSERTGYPEDMLALDADIEADLGIDSIKRVEILGAFRTQMPEPVSKSLEARLPNLTKAKSLQEILDIVSSSSGAVEESRRPFDLAGKGLERALSVPLSRFIIEPRLDPIVPALQTAPLPRGAYVLSEDEGGVAKALALRLEAEGLSVHLLPASLLAERDRVGRRLADIRNEAPIKAVVHLAPIDTRGVPPAADESWWSTALRRDVKSLFALLQLAASDLKTGGRILAASATGGNFLRRMPASDGALAYPGGAGNVGLVKALQFEWPGAVCKAVDLDPALSPEQLAAQLFDELRLPGGRREVGYPGGQRTIFRTVPASLMPVAQPREGPGADWIVLAPGGVRGITAETLYPLLPWKPTLVIVGRTPAPPDEEAETTRDLQDAAALRGHFVRLAREDGLKAKPAEIEAQVARVLREREMRGNLAAFRAAGATVDYRVADVADGAQVDDLLSDVYGAYGRIDAVWYGAGIIEDRLLEEKSPDSFDRVFDTKVMGALQICGRLRRDSLKFVAFFTSVAGRYGNRGQTDYAAANEVLNRLAWSLAAQWGPAVKVAAINWGAWVGTRFGPGMVSAEARRQFESRGVSLIEPDKGRDVVLRELLFAPTDEVEVVVGDNPWEYWEVELSGLPAEAGAKAPRDIKWPLVAGGKLSGNGHGRNFFKEIDLVSDPYLDDHRLDGVPVVPFVCCAEYMAEAASAGERPGVVTDLTDIRLYHGLTLQNGRLPIQIKLADGDGERVTDARIMLLGDKPKPAYRAQVHHADAPHALVRKTIPTDIASTDVNAIEAYRKWLFHGPRFQRITEVLGLDDTRALIKVRASRPAEFYPPANGAEWLFDPGALDAAMQMVVVWSRTARNQTVLPARIQRLTRYGDEPLVGELYVAIHISSAANEPLIRVNFDVVDADGYLRLSVADLQATCSEELNRVGGSWSGGEPKGLA